MNMILWCGTIVILALAGLGVYLGWAAYHEKGKGIVKEVKGVPHSKTKGQ